MKKFSILLLFLICLEARVTPQNEPSLFNHTNSSGITTIKGVILNYEKDSAKFNIEIAIDDWTNAYRRKYFTEIDNNGKFLKSFFIFKTQNVFFTYNNIWTGVFVVPEDTLELIIESDSFPNNTKFIGKTANACENLQFYFKSKPQNWSQEVFTKNQKMRFEMFKTWRDSIHQIEKRDVEKYITHTQLDSLFIEWLRISSESGYRSDLLKYELGIYKVHQSISPDYKNDFYEFVNQVKSIELDSLNHKWSNSGEYIKIINPLYVRLNQIAHIKWYIEEREPLKLSPAKEGQPLKPLNKEEATKSNYPYFLKTARLLVKNDLIRESVIAHNYTITLEESNIDLGLDSTLTFISNSDIRSSLINEYYSYMERKFNQNSLKIDDAGNDLINLLKNKYEGYVLYIDFWSTGCGSCYLSFLSTPEIKNKLKGKKIAFIYLCAHCNKTRWEKDIEEFNITGENILLSQDQYTSLFKTFNIVGVPKYIIIDKNGKIVNDRAPVPSSIPMLQNVLMKELDKYLE